MQEPTLFNYSVSANVLYGKTTASNEEIKVSCDAANASQFIESDDLKMAFDDSAQSLLAAMESEEF